MTVPRRISQPVALFLSVLLFANNSVLASLAEGQIWADRRERQSSDRQQWARLTTPALDLPGVRAGSALMTSRFMRRAAPRLQRHEAIINSLPFSFGTIRALSRPRHSAKGVIVHVQDIHRNNEAQRNISDALRHLFQNEKIGLLALEGAFASAGDDDRLDIEPVRKFPDAPLVRAVADHLLDEKKISGPIHTSLTEERSPVTVGIDDQTHYTENIAAYREAAHSRSRAESLVNDLTSRFEMEKRNSLSPGLLRLDDRAAQYHRGKLDLLAYLKGFSDSERSRHHQIALFFEAAEMEGTIDFANVERERNDLLKRLAKQLTPSDLDDLMTASLDLRHNKLSTSDFYSFLRTLCRKHNIDLARLPSLNQYIQYVLMSDALNTERLFEDVAVLEENAIRALSPSSAERGIMDFSRRLQLTRKLLSFSLNSSEWTAYEKLAAGPIYLPRPNIENLNRTLRPFERFYKQARARDAAMAGNLLRQMKNAKTSNAVLVTGGFHAKHITTMLNDEGYTVATYVPRVTKVNETDDSLSIFTQEKSPLEKLFDGDKLFLAAPPLPPAVLQTEIPAILTAAREAKNKGPLSDADRKALASVKPASHVTIESEDIGPDTAIANVRGAGGTVRVQVSLKPFSIVSSAALSWGDYARRWLAKTRLLARSQLDGSVDEQDVLVRAPLFESAKYLALLLALYAPLAYVIPNQIIPDFILILPLGFILSIATSYLHGSQVVVKATPTSSRLIVARTTPDHLDHLFIGALTFNWLPSLTLMWVVESARHLPTIESAAFIGSFTVALWLLSAFLHREVTIFNLRNGGPAASILDANSSLTPSQILESYVYELTTYSGFVRQARTHALTGNAPEARVSLRKAAQAVDEVVKRLPHFESHPALRRVLEDETLADIRFAESALKANDSLLLRVTKGSEVPEAVEALFRIGAANPGWLDNGVDQITSLFDKERPVIAEKIRQEYERVVGEMTQGEDPHAVFEKIREPLRNYGAKVRQAQQWLAANNTENAVKVLDEARVLGIDISKIIEKGRPHASQLEAMARYESLDHYKGNQWGLGSAAHFIAFLEADSRHRATILDSKIPRNIDVALRLMSSNPEWLTDLDRTRHDALLADAVKEHVDQSKLRAITFYQLALPILDRFVLHFQKAQEAARQENLQKVRENLRLAWKEAKSLQDVVSNYKANHAYDADFWTAMIHVERMVKEATSIELMRVLIDAPETFHFPLIQGLKTRDTGNVIAALVAQSKKSPAWLFDASKTWDQLIGEVNPSVLPASKNQTKLILAFLFGSLMSASAQTTDVPTMMLITSSQVAWGALAFFLIGSSLAWLYWYAHHGRHDIRLLRNIRLWILKLLHGDTISHVWYDQRSPDEPVAVAATRELERLRRFRARVKENIENPAAAPLRKTVVISDEHGTIDKFDALIVDALRSVFPTRVPTTFTLDPDAPLNEQLLTLGLRSADILDHLYFQNLGDLMDRGPSGIKVYRRARQLIKMGLSDFVIGNHDLWMFMSLRGIHLPSYKNFNFHGYRDEYDRHHGKVDELVATAQETQIEPKRPRWWAEKFYTLTQDYDELQISRWRGLDVRIGGEYVLDAKGRDKERVPATGLYAQVSANLGENKKYHEIWDKLRGDFYDILVFSGTRAVSKMSRQWWIDLLREFEDAYREIQRLPDYDSARPLPYHEAWAEAVRTIRDDIIPQLTADLEGRLERKEWWARVYEAIMYKNYTSSEWWAIDWISHDGWGTSVTKERNKELKERPSGLNGDELTPGNYIDDDQLQEIAGYNQEVFNLFRRDEYQNTYMHAFLPIDQQTGEFYFQYQGKTYRGKGIGNTPSVWIGLQKIAWDVQYARDLSEMNEALQLVNSWYADATTKTKAEHVAWAINKFGPDELARVNGFNRLFIGHIPLQDFKKLSSDALGVIRGFHVPGAENGRIFFTDHGMGERFGARGGAVHVSERGIWLRGFEQASSREIIDHPRTVKPAKDLSVEGQALFNNAPLTRESFLPDLLQNIDARIKELEPAAGKLVLPNVVTPHVKHRLRTVFWNPAIELFETIPALFSKRLRDDFINRHPSRTPADQAVRLEGFKQIRRFTFLGTGLGAIFAIVLTAHSAFIGAPDLWTWIWPFFIPFAVGLLTHYFTHSQFNNLHPLTPLALEKRAGNIDSRQLNHQLALNNYFFKKLLSLNIRMLLLESRKIYGTMHEETENKQRLALIRELTDAHRSLALSISRSRNLTPSELEKRKHLLERLANVISLAGASFQAAAWALNGVALTAGQHYTETYEKKLNRAATYRHRHPKVEFIRATGAYALLQSKYRRFTLFGHPVAIRTFIRKHFSTLWEAYEDLDQQIEDELDYKEELDRVMVMVEPVLATLEEAVEQKTAPLPDSLRDALLENLRTAFSRLHPHWVATKELAHLGIRAAQLQLEIGAIESSAHTLRMTIRLLHERKREVNNILYNLERSRLAEVRDVTVQRNDEFLARIAKKDFDWLLNRAATKNEPDFHNLAHALQAAKSATGADQAALLNDAANIVRVSNALFRFVKDYRIGYTRLRNHLMPHDEAQSIAFATAYEQFLRKHPSDNRIDRNSALGRWWRLKFHTNLNVSPFLQTTKKVAFPTKNQNYAALEMFSDILQINEISKILASPVLNLETAAPRAFQVIKSVSHKKTHIKSIPGAPKFLNTAQYDDLLRALAADFSIPDQKVHPSTLKNADNFTLPLPIPLDAWAASAPEGSIRLATSVEELDDACRAALAQGRVITLLDSFEDLKRGAAVAVSVYEKEIVPSPFKPLMSAVKTLYERQMKAGHVANGEWVPAIHIVESGSSVFYATYRKGRRAPDLHVGGLSLADQMESQLVAFLNTGRTKAPAKTEGVALTALDPEDEERRRLEPGRFEKHNPSSMWILWQGSAHVRSNNPWRVFFNPYPTWPPRTHRPFDEQPLQLVATRGDGPVTQTVLAARENVQDALHLQNDLNRPLISAHLPLPWSLASAISKVLMEALEEQHPFNFSVSPTNRSLTPQFTIAVNSFPGGGASQAHAHFNLGRWILPTRNLPYGLPMDQQYHQPQLKEGVHFGIQDSMGRSIVMESAGLKANVTIRVHAPSEPGIGDGFDLYGLSVNLTDLLKFALLSTEQRQTWRELQDAARKLWIFNQFTSKAFHIREDLFATLLGIVERTTLPTSALINILQNAGFFSSPKGPQQGAIGWMNLIMILVSVPVFMALEPTAAHAAWLFGGTILLIVWHEGGHWLEKTVRDGMFSWHDYPRFALKGLERGLVVPGSRGWPGLVASGVALFPITFLLISNPNNIVVWELLIINMIILASTRDWSDVTSAYGQADHLAQQIVEASESTDKVTVVQPLEDRFNLDGKSTVLLLKPSAGKPVHSTVKAILERARKNGYDINGVRVYDGSYIAETGMMGRHYVPHYQAARQGLQYNPAEINAGISQMYSDSAFKNSRPEILGVLEAEARGIPRDVISRKWREADAAPASDVRGNKKLMPGVRSVLMNFTASDRVPAEFVGPPFIILNGFYPTMAEEFEKAGNKTIAISLKPAVHIPTKWNDMRQNFAGDTNPEKANAGSIRSDAFKGILKVRVQPISMTNNLIHLTENLGQEAIDETNNWFRFDLEKGNELAGLPGLGQVLTPPAPLGLRTPPAEEKASSKTMFERLWDLRYLLLSGKTLGAALRSPLFKTAGLDVIIVGPSMLPRLETIATSIHPIRPTVIVAENATVEQRLKTLTRANVMVLNAETSGLLENGTLILRELENQLVSRGLVTKKRSVNVVFDQNASPLDFDGLLADSIFRNRGTLFLMIDAYLRVLTAVPAGNIEAIIRAERAAAIAA
jgi:hypothetical protein